MTVYAISDLHLPGRGGKQMDVFGEKWEDHFDRIAQDWVSRVEETDVVLLPGDLSWAMKLEDALEDIEKIASLPGRKVLLRGNHDYWWTGIGRVRDALKPGMYALQNDAVSIDGLIFCGTRGWKSREEGWAEGDEKIYLREIKRLELSIQNARRLGDGTKICLMHYPPISAAQQDTPFTQLIEEGGISAVVYGHLHGPALKGAFRGEYNGVRYIQASCDGTGFKLENVMRA
ncbi:MAG: metallophosphoesterase [Clostridiales bacterium]|nr:metallophosphoesterase [Clostridiales bacterium]